MKNSMGIHHSSLRCDRITLSVQNCFGLRDSTTNYETANGTTNKNVENDEKETHLIKTRKRSSKRISCAREGCCIKSKTTDSDDFAYNLCSKDSTSSVSQTDVSDSAPSVVTSSKISSENHVCIGNQTCQTITCNNTISKTNEFQNGVIQNGVIMIDSQPQSLSTMDTLVHTCGENETKTVLHPSSTQEQYILTNHIKTEEKSYLNNNGSCKCESNTKTLLNNKQCLDNTNKVKTNDAYISLNNEEKNTDLKEEKTNNECKEVVYFRNLILTETNRLNICIEKWSRVLMEDKQAPKCPTEICDEIRTVIGQSRLVISERFTQFSSLVDRASGKTKSATDELPVLISDLQGFWDMIYFQVEDVLKKFEALRKLESNQWQNASPKLQIKTENKQTSVIKKKTTQKKSPPKKTVSDEDKKRRAAARKRLLEARKAMNQRKQQNDTNTSANESVGKTDNNDENVFSTGPNETRTEPINTSCSGSVVSLTNPAADSPLLSQIPSASELVH